MGLTCAQFALPFLFICGLNALSAGQSKPPLLQQISLTDKVLERNLSDYAKVVGAKIITVNVEKRDSIYRYELTPAYFFESLDGHSRSPWGKWGNCILLFSSRDKSDLTEILSVRDTCPFDSLLNYARPLLPNQFTETLLEDGIIMSEVRLIHGLDWVFTVKGGREVWLWTSNGFDSRDIPQPE